MSPSKKKEFFNNIAINMNTVDLDVAKNAYYAIMKFIVRETKKQGELQLPDFGTFRISVIKGRLSNMPRSNERKYVPPSNMMKFKPDYKVGYYINK